MVDQLRHDLQRIHDWIEPHSRVLDLGCGEGHLLEQLKQHKAVQGYGLDIDIHNIQCCVKRGVNVIQQDISQGLDNFADNSFDTVVMTQAIQTMRNPHRVLQEMLRIGRECVITFPNFGHWRVRWLLLQRGRMPVSDLMPYQWFDTPNIHFCTIKDFEVLCRDLNIEVIRREMVAEPGLGNLLKNALPNLFGVTALYHLRKINGTNPTPEAELL